MLQDNPYVRTKCPQDQVTEADILRRVKNANLAAGDVIKVQCMNSDYTELLWSSEWEITARKTEMKTYEINDQNTRTVEEITYRIKLSAPWRPTHDVVETEGPAVMRKKWDVNKRGYDILAGDIVIGFHEDKETAERIVAGELPLEAV